MDVGPNLESSQVDRLALASNMWVCPVQNKLLTVMSEYLFVRRLDRVMVSDSMPPDSTQRQIHTRARGGLIHSDSRKESAQVTCFCNPGMAAGGRSYVEMCSK